MSPEIRVFHDSQFPQERPRAFIADFRCHHLDLNDLIAAAFPLQ
jgi:hypothetical protein